jgi:hypothetical protein
MDKKQFLGMLSSCASNGNLQLMKDIEQVYGKYDVYNDKNEITKKALMHDAAIGGNVEIMEWLKARGARVNIRTISDFKLSRR